MATILGTDSIRSSIPKMVETQDEFIINGQVYNKYNLSPQPFKTLAIEGTVSGLLDPIMYDSVYINSKDAGSVPRNTSSILIDDVDSNITYMINNTNNNTLYLIRLTKTSKNIKQEKVALLTMGIGYSGQASIIDQDSDNIYVFHNTGVNDMYAYNSRIVQINKASLAITTVNLSGGRSSVVYKDSVNIYIASISGAGILKVFKYTKSSASFTTIVIQNSETVNQYLVKALISAATVSSNVLSFYYFVDYATATHNLVARRCDINLVSGVTSVNNVTIDFNQLDASSLFLPYIDYYDKVIIEQVPLAVNGTMYISLVVYTTGSGITPTDLNYIYTFKIISQNNLQLISKTELSTSYKALLTLNNNHTLILANVGVATFFKWDDTTFKYVKTGDYFNEIAFISRDMNNAIWIQHANTSVEQISLSIPLEINTDFEKDEYEYIDTDIYTYIRISAKNFAGGYIEATLNLVLTGNCHFADNNTKLLTINTSNAGPINVPVIIAGESIIGINTSII